MNKLRKIFTVSVMFVTVLSMSVVVAPSASANVAQSGDLIKMDGLSAVYYLGNDNKRYVFPNETTFKSWYSDFSSVVTVSQAELQSYQLAKNITMRAGTKLVKITTDPRVYAVAPNGELKWIGSEEAAKTLYGENWAKRVVDVPDQFISNYRVNGKGYGDASAADITATEVTGSTYPNGTLLKYAGSSDIYLIDGGAKRKIATEAVFISNRYQFSDVIEEVPTTFTFTAGAGITSQEADLVDTTSGSGGTASESTGSGLTIALASDTPAAATIIANGTDGQNAQALVPFVKLNLTASADGDVKVTNLRFKRTGISADTDVDALYLYEGDSVVNPLIDGASVSSTYVTFNNSNGIFTVDAGTTKTITLRGDLLDNLSAGKTIGFSVEAASDITTNGASVSGSFPATGNNMSTAQASDLGKLTFSSYTVPSSNQTALDPDQKDYEIWKVTFVGANQELELHNVKFTAVGSIQQNDLANFKLYNGGTLLGEVASMNSDNEVDFDLSSDPFFMDKGASKILSLRADVVGGSTREVYMSFQNATDVVVKDKSYGVFVQPYVNNNWSVIKPTEEYLISSGSLSVSKSTTSPTEDLALDQTSSLLAKYDFRAAGEDIKVKNLLVGAYTTSNVGIDNVKVYQDGVQRGSTSDIDAGSSATTTYSFGSTFVVPAGETSIVEIYGDVKKADGTSFSNTNTIKIEIYTGSSNAQRMASLGTFDAPGSAVEANSLTITAAGLAVNKYSGYGDQTIVAGTSNAKMGSFVVTAGSSEGIDVSSITIALDSTANEAGTITNMYLKDNATGEQIGTTKVSPSTSNIFSVNFNLAASASKIIDLYADIKSGVSAGTWNADIDAQGTGKDTGKTADASNLVIQTITIGNGSLYVAGGSQPDSAILLAGTTGNAAAQFTFDAANEAFTISKLQLKTENNFASNTANVTIKYPKEDGTTGTASTIFVASASQAYATATFDGLDMYVVKGQSADLDVEVDTVLLSSGGASGNSGKIYLDWNNGFKAVGTSGASKTDMSDSLSADLSANTFYIRKSIPTFTKVAITGSPSSSAPLYKFTAVADAKGNIDLKQLSFTFTTDGVTIVDAYLYDPNTSTQLTDTKVDPDANGHVALIWGRQAVAGSGTAGDDDIATISTTAKTFEVRGTVSGYSSTAGDSITVQFRQDTVATSTAAVGTKINDAAYNVWSDRSASAHTTATTDWTSGYLLKNMAEPQSF